MNTVERIKQICKERKIALSKMEKDLGFGNGYIGGLRKGTVPDDRLRSISKYLNLSIDYLTLGNDVEENPEYYLNADAREMAQFMFENPEYKALFDASRKVSKEDIETVKAILDKFKSHD